MKIFRLLCLLIIVEVITIPCHAKKSINFGGKWNHIKKTIIQEPVVKAWIDEQDIFISFSTSLGSVSITIVNMSGKVIYSRVVNTCEVPFWEIRLDNLNKGEYIISIADNMNQITGMFIYDYSTKLL